MANISGTNVASAVRPFTDADNYAVALANEIKGGNHSKISISDRNAIPLERRESGMMCYVEDTNKTYKLILNPMTASTVDANWEDFTTGGGSNSNQSQYTNLSVLANTSKLLAIPYTADFNRQIASVLKYVAGGNNVLTTENNFNNGEQSGFNINDKVIFDGFMHLKTSYPYSFIPRTWTGVGQYAECDINSSIFKNIENVIITTPSASLVPILTSGASSPPIVVTDNKHVDIRAAWCMFDGLLPVDDGSGMWFSTTVPAEAVIDFGSIKTFNNYSIRSAYSNNADYHITDWTISVSTDGLVYTVIDTRVAEVWGTDYIRTYNSVGSGRFLKLTVTKSSNSVNHAYFTIGEMAIYGGISKYLTKTLDGHYWSHKTGIWVDLGIPANDTALQVLFQNNGEDIPPTQITHALLSTGAVRCFWTSSATLALPTVAVTAVPLDQLVSAIGDISLIGVNSFNSFTITTNQTVNGKIFLVASPDSGATWYAYKAGVWVKVVDFSVDYVRANGNTPIEFNSIPGIAWGVLLINQTVRFAYAISMTTSTDVANTDTLSSSWNMKGIYKQAICGTDYNVSYIDNNYMQVDFIVAGGYKVNY